MASKRAIQRLVVGKDGRLKTILIDLATLEEVIDPTGYHVVSASNPEPEPVTDVDDPTVVTEVQEELEEPDRGGGERDSGAVDPRSSFPDAPAPFSQTQAARGTAPRGTSVARQAIDQAVSAPVDSRTTQPSPSNPNPIANPRGVATADTAADTHTGPGGFANLTPDRDSNISYSLAGAQRNQQPDPGFMSGISEAAKGYFGPDYSVDVTSGKGRLAGPSGNANHPTGLAADFDVVNDVTGKKVDQATMEDFGAYAAAQGFTGIGIGPGYMNPGRMHLDTVHKSPTAWGKQNTASTMTPGVNTAIEQAGIAGAPVFGMGLPGPGAPTPTARPDPNAAPNLGTNSLTPSRFDMGEERKSVAEQTIAEAKNVTAPMQGFAGGGVNKPGSIDRSTNKFAGVDLAKATPASFASLGLSTRTPAEVGRIGQMIAGELGPDSLKALAANDPKARQELANIAASVENRANSKMFKDLDEALAPSQYNSLLSENLETTNQNYGIYGSAIKNALDDFYSGNLKPTDDRLSSYYNPNEVNPSWGGMMKNAQDVGQHRFGSLSEYGPGSAFRTERDRMAKAQVSDTRGFTPDRDYSGSGFAGSKDSPSEGGSRFGGGLGYSAGGGRDSPSEGGSRFGGSGLGSGKSGYSGKGGKDSPSEGGSRFGGSGLGSGGVKSDKSSKGGGPVDKGEKGWGGGSSSSGSKSSKSGGGVKSDKSSKGGGPVDKAEKGW